MCHWQRSEISHEPKIIIVVDCHVECSETSSTPCHVERSEASLYSLSLAAQRDIPRNLSYFIYYREGIRGDKRQHH